VGSIRSGGSTNPYLALADGTTEAYFEIASSVTRISSGTSQPLAFRIGSSEAARIDTSNRILVGTSTARTIEPYGLGTDGQVAHTIESIGDSAPGPGLALCSNSTIARFGPYLYLCRTRSTSVGGDILVASGDNLGTISFAGANGSGVRTRGAAIFCEVDATPGAADMPGRLVFSTTLDGASSPTERMRLTNQGAIWAASNGGVSTFGATTHYHGLVQNEGGQWVLGLQNNGGGGGLGFGLTINYSNTTPNNTGNTFIQGVDATAARFVVRSNGGIANYQANDVNLCDEREKKNIVNLESTWDCLKRWELKKFHYNEDADTDDLRYGVIAQQVAPHCPEVITNWVKQQAEPVKLDDDGNEIEPAKKEIVRMGVKEQQMMWMAINALQEAQLRIETLEAEVATLKAS
jgi:hypothetical protein